MTFIIAALVGAPIRQSCRGRKGLGGVVCSKEVSSVITNVLIKLRL